MSRHSPRKDAENHVRVNDRKASNFHNRLNIIQRSSYPIAQEVPL
jgi:hypothetical protein